MQMGGDERLEEIMNRPEDDWGGWCKDAEKALGWVKGSDFMGEVVF